MSLHVRHTVYIIYVQQQDGEKQAPKTGNFARNIERDTPLRVDVYRILHKINLAKAAANRARARDSEVNHRLACLYVYVIRNINSCAAARHRKLRQNRQVCARYWGRQTSKRTHIVHRTKQNAKAAVNRARARDSEVNLGLPRPCMKLCTPVLLLRGCVNHNIIPHRIHISPGNA